MCVCVLGLSNCYYSNCYGDCLGLFTIMMVDVLTIIVYEFVWNKYRFDQPK